MPSRRSRSISTRTSPDRLDDTGSFEGGPSTTNVAFDSPGPLADRAVDPPGVAVLAPAALADRAPSRDLHPGPVGERGDRLADVPGRQPGGRLGLRHRVLAVGHAVAARDPRQRLRALVARHLDERRLLGEGAQQVDQRVLVLGQLVHVVRREPARPLVVDEPEQLPPGDDVAGRDLAALEPDERVGRRVAADVPALDVDPEHGRVERARSATHGPP